MLRNATNRLHNNFHHKQVLKKVEIISKQHLLINTHRDQKNTKQIMYTSRYESKPGGKKLSSRQKYYQERITKAEVEVKQLKIHLSQPRIPVSKASSDLLNFVLNAQRGDPLVAGFPAGRNPYTKQNDCCIIM